MTTVGYEPGDIRETWVRAVLPGNGTTLEFRTDMNIWDVEVDDNKKESRTGIPAIRLLVTLYATTLPPLWIDMNSGWEWSNTTTGVSGQLTQSRLPRRYVPNDPSANSLEIMAAAYRTRAYI